MIGRARAKILRDHFLPATIFGRRGRVHKLPRAFREDLLDYSFNARPSLSGFCGNNFTALRLRGDKLLCRNCPNGEKPNHQSFHGLLHTIQSNIFDWPCNPSAIGLLPVGQVDTSPDAGHSPRVLLIGGDLQRRPRFDMEGGLPRVAGQLQDQY